MDSIREGSTLSRLPSIPSMSTSGAVELPPKAADADRSAVGAGGAGGGRYGDAGRHALQCDRRGDDGPFVECRGVDGRYGSRDVDFFLRSVADDYHFVDLFIVALEGDFVVGFGCDLDGCVLIADIGNRELLAFCGVQREFTL